MQTCFQGNIIGKHALEEIFSYKKYNIQLSPLKERVSKEFWSFMKHVLLYYDTFYFDTLHENLSLFDFLCV